MKNINDRGILTKEIQEQAKTFLNREITTTELRLYPYLDYVVKNEGCMKFSHVNIDEMYVLGKLLQEGHLKFVGAKIFLTKKFYDFIQNILWKSYVLEFREEK